YHRAAHRAGYLHLRLGHPDRGGPVVPGHRHPAGAPHLGLHHWRRPVALSHLFPPHLLTGPVLAVRGACPQPVARGIARRARAAFCQAGVTRMAEAPVLDLKGLMVELPRGSDRPHAIEGITFSVDAGQIVCVVGESGSGKSVTAQAVMGLLPRELNASAGQVLLQGEDVLQATASRLRDLRGTRMAMIFQEPMTALN